MLLIKTWSLSIRVEMTHLCATHAMIYTYKFSLTKKLRFHTTHFHSCLFLSEKPDSKIPK